MRTGLAARAFVALSLATILASTEPAKAWPSNESVKKLTLQACEDRTAFWSLWLALSGRDLSDREIRSRPIFPLPEVLAALQAVPLTRPLPAKFGEAIENYRSPYYYNARGTLWQQTEAYARAASAYEHEDFPEAIRQFDAIVASGVVPPRHLSDALFPAAAAYTAARAAFRLGNFQDGARRIAGIIGDPTLHEFWPQAWNLIAYMRYETDAAPLVAAEFAQISRLLTTPSNVLCPDPSNGEHYEIEEFSRTILAEEDFTLLSVPLFSGQIEIMAPGFDYAKQDPVIAAAMAMGSSVEVDRAGWQETHNLLWALALSEHGELQDLPTLADAIAVARSYSPHLSDRAHASLVVSLAAARAHILAKAGKQAEALAAISAPTVDEWALLRRDPPELMRDSLTSLVSATTRELLAQHQWAAARQWAIDSSAAVHWPIDETLKPFLVTGLSELYRHPVLQLAAVDGEIRLGTLRWLLDSWSSKQLIEFSRRYDVAPMDRRIMVGAAWMRAFALRHWRDVFDWLPDLRLAYPMLAPDIDLIDGAWLPATKRHLALRLALRAPGLVAMPSWSRPPGNLPHAELVDNAVRPADVLALDPWNASDGNWWCSPTPSADDWRWGLAIYSDSGALPGNVLFAAVAPLFHEGDGKELAALNAAGSSTQRFAEDAVAWGKHAGWLQAWFGGDEYLPETLHLAVRATRFGCRRPPDNSPWSRAAFQLLHRRYPTSESTKATPYWFGFLSGQRSDSQR